MNLLLPLFSLILFASSLFLLTKGETAFLLEGKPISTSTRIRAKRMFSCYGFFFLLLALGNSIMIFWRQDALILLLLLAAASGAALFSWQLHRLLKIVLNGKDDPAS